MRARLSPGRATNYDSTALVICFPGSPLSLTVRFYQHLPRTPGFFAADGVVHRVPALIRGDNLAVLADLPGRWIGAVHDRWPPKSIILCQSAFKHDPHGAPHSEAPNLESINTENARKIQMRFPLPAVGQHRLILRRRDAPVCHALQPKPRERCVLIITKSTLSCVPRSILAHGEIFCTAADSALSGKPKWSKVRYRCQFISGMSAQTGTIVKQD